LFEVAKGACHYHPILNAHRRAYLTNQKRREEVFAVKMMRI